MSERNGVNDKLNLILEKVMDKIPSELQEMKSEQVLLKDEIAELRKELGEMKETLKKIYMLLILLSVFILVLLFARETVAILANMNNAMIIHMPK